MVVVMKISIKMHVVRILKDCLRSSLFQILEAIWKVRTPIIESKIQTCDWILLTHQEFVDLVLPMSSTLQRFSTCLLLMLDNSLPGLRVLLLELGFSNQNLHFLHKNASCKYNAYLLVFVRFLDKSVLSGMILYCVIEYVLYLSEIHNFVCNIPLPIRLEKFRDLTSIFSNVERYLVSLFSWAFSAILILMFLSVAANKGKRITTYISC